MMLSFLSTQGYVESERYRSISDESLVDLYQETGDLAIVCLLIQRLQSSLAAVFYSYAKDRFEFDDYTQELFLKLANSLRTVKIRGSVKRWIFSFAKNRVIDEMRKMKRADEFKNEIKKNIQTLEEFQLDNELDLKQLALKALSFLSQEEHMCIKLYYLEEKSYREIAKELDWKYKKVCNHIQRGMEKLRSKMGGQSGFFEDL